MRLTMLILLVSSAYVSANDENGERILHTAPTSPLPKAPALPPKQGLSQSHEPYADSCTQTTVTIITAFILVLERSLAQQPPVQVSCPRPPYPDVTSAGLAHQPDETTHPLPFTSRTEWVHNADITCCNPSWFSSILTQWAPISTLAVFVSRQ